MSRLGQDNLRSPNAIPPRTSSTGISHSHTRSSKPVLRPLPESDWISQGRKMPEPVNGTTPHSTDPVQAAIECTRRGARAWSDEKEKILQGPYDYMFSHPGKDIRSQLIAGFNSWLKVPEDSLAIITKVVGMLHTASLLVDDVEDGSVLRRGIPVAHSIFGTAQAINSANYVYFCALREIQALNNPIAIQIFTEELINLHRGQGMDLYWRDALTCPTEEDYLEMVGNKTGGLFRLAIKLMQAQSQSDKNCIPLADLIGVIFQVQDDYQNLQSTVYTENKGLCEDLTEGKFSFPIIHSIRAAPDNLQLLNILRQKTTDDGVKCYAVAYMESTGSFEYTRQFVRSLTEKAYTYVDELDAGEGGGEGIRVILGKLGRL